MKKLSNEEKAKRYDEAIKRAKNYHSTTDSVADTELIELIFPELNESEDEKIRKSIICGMNALKEQRKETFASIPINDCIAWLEKQGHKPTDKLEPKFKVGDWIINGDYTWKVTAIQPLDYILQSQNGNTVDDTISYVDEYFHLWTIQNAKNGDVLTNGKMIVIFKHFEDPSYRQHIVAYIGLDNSGNIQITDDTWRLGIDKAKPATKEQRDILFQKMHEGGYEWDAEKKELKLLITNGGDFESENCEQKPTWSEEDEEMLTEIITDVKFAQERNPQSQMNQIIFEEEVNWLKSLKQRLS